MFYHGRKCKSILNLRDNQQQKDMMLENHPSIPKSGK